MKKAPYLKTCLVFAAVFLVPVEVVSAQGGAMNDAPQNSVYESSKEASTTSVYDASTQIAEKPKIKSLNVEEFGTFAQEICKKYGFDGPTVVSNQTERALLLNQMSTLRKDLFKRLCDPKIRKDGAAKEIIQDQMKALSEDIRSFPILTGVGKGSSVLVQESVKLNLQPTLRMIGDSLPVVRDQIEKKMANTTCPSNPRNESIYIGLDIDSCDSKDSLCG